METINIYVAVQRMTLNGDIRLRLQNMDSDGKPVDVYFEPATLAKLMENADNVMEVTVKVEG